MRATMKSLVATCLCALLLLALQLNRGTVAASSTAVQYRFDQSPQILGTERLPVKLTQVRHRNNELPIGQTVGGEVEFLNEVSLKLKNVSDKEVSSIRVQFSLLDAATGAEIGNGLAVETNNRLRPDQEEVTALPRASARSLRTIATESGIALRQVRVDIDYVIFADGTLWKSGLLHRQAKANPNDWVAIGMEAAYQQLLTAGNLSRDPALRGFRAEKASFRPGGKVFLCAYWVGIRRQSCGPDCNATYHLSSPTGSGVLRLFEDQLVDCTAVGGIVCNTAIVPRVTGNC